MGSRWVALALASNLAIASTALAAEPAAEPEGRTRRFELGVGLSGEMVLSPYGVSSDTYTLGVWSLGARVSARWWMADMLALELHADLGGGKTAALFSDGESHSARSGVGVDLVFGLPTLVSPIAGLGAGWSRLDTRWDEGFDFCWGLCDGSYGDSGRTVSTTWLLTPLAGVAFGRGPLQAAMLCRVGFPLVHETAGADHHDGNGIVIDLELRVAARF